MLRDESLDEVEPRDTVVSAHSVNVLEEKRISPSEDITPPPDDKPPEVNLRK